MQHSSPRGRFVAGHSQLGGMLVALAVGICTGLVTPNALAQDSSTIAARRDLINQATAASGANDHRRALDLAVRANQIQSSTSLRMFIAQEQNTLHQYVDSMGTADVCIREAEHDAALRSRETILQQCRALQADANAHVGHVTIRFDVEQPSDVHVTVNGNPVPSALVGAPIAVDPGQVVVEATATGYRPFRREVVVSERSNADVHLAPVHEAAQTAVASAATSQPTHAQGASTNVPALVVAGVGALGLVASGVLFAVQFSMVGSFEQNYCYGPDNTTCVDTPDSESQLATLRAVNTSAFVALGVGGAMLIGGGAWWLLTRRNGGHAEHAHLEVTPTSGGMMIGIGGVL